MSFDKQVIESFNKLNPEQREEVVLFLMKFYFMVNTYVFKVTDAFNKFIIRLGLEKQTAGFEISENFINEIAQTISEKDDLY